MYLDLFIRHVYPKMVKSHNATGEMRQFSAERYLFATMQRDTSIADTGVVQQIGHAVGGNLICISGCPLEVAFYHYFSIDNNVFISSPCSKTVHTKFTKPLSF